MVVDVRRRKDPCREVFTWNEVDTLGRVQCFVVSRRALTFRCRGPVEGDRDRTVQWRGVGDVVETTQGGKKPIAAAARVAAEGVTRNVLIKKRPPPRGGGPGINLGSDEKSK